MKKIFVFFVLFSLLSALKSEAKLVNGSFSIKFGVSDGKDGCDYRLFSVCSIGLSLKAVLNSGSQIMGFSGEVRNNMLIINLPKEIRGEGNNSPGTYTYTLSRQIDLDADLAKELGFEKLSIAPGNYEFTGKTISLKIVSPRGVSTGQASGKRNNIAIDEQGVHKTSTPQSTGPSNQ